MKQLLLFICLIFSVSTAFAGEPELVMGGGYTSEEMPFFHSQFGWKFQIIPMLTTIDYDYGGKDNIRFHNLDLNSSLYYKHFSVGVGLGYQWGKDYSWIAGDTIETWESHIDYGDYLYIKPNVALTFKYMKFSLESRIFADSEKSPEFAFTISLRDQGVLVAVAATMIAGLAILAG
ncbi:MAG: hypothetical protein LBV04_00160, partial [Deferribacteraceae bacterium]|nr:hypothetical protein [Deferribacteraceae bacterium]